MAIADSVRALERDLRDIFAARLHSLVIYRPTTDAPGAPVPTLATVQQITADDLRACASKVAAWHETGLATPLLVAIHELARALDAFPLEFAAILDDHTLVTGADPFRDLQVDAADLRRACEVQARSHLLHLREGYIEACGRGDAIADLIADSSAPLSGLLKSVARLLGAPTLSGAAAAKVVEQAADLVPGSLSAVAVLRRAALTGEEGRRLFAGYLAAIERLTQFIDHWSRP